ncbi:hypothetical protein K501DRAFT_145324, partial [Backusella circina FSU 941]
PSPVVRPTKREQKTQSLYIKSFRKPETTYDKSEAVQQNSKDIRNTIRRSLSAVLYASPHSKTSSSDGGSENTSNTLVPVLVTPELSDSVGGIMLETPTKQEEEQEEKKKKKKKVVEYDNSMDIMRSDGKATIVWQGYGYVLNNEQEGLEDDFEPEIWEEYRGLIHPLHLFNSMEERWQELSVTELRRYYDNYGSMMLKIRETRMIEQQRQYKSSSINSDWIIPRI